MPTPRTAKRKNSPRPSGPAASAGQAAGSTSIWPGTWSSSVSASICTSASALSEPGSSQASYYASLVDFRDRNDENIHLKENVLIALNQPADFSDPATGRSYRFFQEGMSQPYRPGSPAYEAVVRGRDMRPQVFQSFLTANYDPGRGLKYAGSVLVMVGLAIVFYMRARSFRRARRAANGLRLVALAAVLAAAAGPVRAASSADLDWSTWQRLPVFDQGRIMPLDTFARAAAAAICGRENPRLSLEGAVGPSGAGDPETAPELAEAGKLFAGSASRRFTAAELLLSWLVEPQRWENVPFLRADHQAVRDDLLHVPLFDRHGRKLDYVSPSQVLGAADFRRRLSEIHAAEHAAEKKGSHVEPVGVDKKVLALERSYVLFRRLSFDPATAEPLARDNFSSTLGDAVPAWSELAPLLQQWAKVESDEKTGALLRRTAEAVDRLVALVEKEQFSLAEVDPLLAAVRQDMAELAARYDELARRAFAEPVSPEGKMARQRRQMRGLVASKVAELARQADDAYLALYESGHSLRLVPALNPAALESTRGESDNAQPWLDVRVMLNGSRDLLRGYPQAELSAVRQAFAKVKAAYLDRENPERKVNFSGAMDEFASRLRRLGEKIGPLREKLDLRSPDAACLAATAYPPSGSTDLEVRYNQLDPFGWAWIVNFVAVLCFASPSARSASRCSGSPWPCCWPGRCSWAAAS